MKILCSYCLAELGDKPPFDDLRTSHTICKACEAHFVPQWDGLSLSEYLDRFPQPVIVVNGQSVVTAVNQAVVDMSGRSREDLVGQLGGEVMECEYARLPEGCGQTEHCELCTIRNTIMTALQTGEPQVHARVQLQKTDLMEMVISVYPYGNVVKVVLE